MRALSSFLLAVIALQAGCSLCPPGYLDDYATVGGPCQRLDPTRGRVGSLFSDPGTENLVGHAGVVGPAVMGDGVPYNGNEVIPSAPGAIYPDGSLQPQSGDTIVEPSILDSDPPSFEVPNGEIIESFEVVPAPTDAMTTPDAPAPQPPAETGVSTSFNG